MLAAWDVLDPDIQVELKRPEPTHQTERIDPPHEVTLADHHRAGAGDIKLLSRPSNCSPPYM
jgi:hypothetical protein